MSSPTPVHINELSVASSLSPTDTLPVSQSGIDRQVPVSLLKAIEWASIPQATILNPTDEVLIFQGATKRIPSSFFNFPAGTKMWFFQDAAPFGWTVVAYPGDALLALKGGAVYTTGGAIQGSWQMPDVGGIPGNGLTIDQIPNHHHWGQFGRTQSNSDAKYIWGAADQSAGGNPRYGQLTDLGIVGGLGDNATHNNYGACNPHNHGNNFRPVGYTGIIAMKN